MKHPKKRRFILLVSSLVLVAALIGLHISRKMEASALFQNFGIISNRFPPPIPTNGQFTVTSCSKLNGVMESCYWRYTYNMQNCSEKNKCSKLVILFSGGDMGCDDSYGTSDSPYSRALKGYADDGYIAICANVFMTEKPGASIPFNQEADRINKIVTDIRTSKVINALWDGKHLLFAGVSHGASAPVDAMTRSNFDDNQNWKGDKTTAACFHDGIYDIPALDNFLANSTTPLACNLLRSRLICKRYFGTDDCSSPRLLTPGVALDTVASALPLTFAVKNWKLIECGSALPACAASGDWVPAGPIQQLCSNIDDGPIHNCAFDSLPNESHLSCIGTTEGIAKCRDWFDMLVKK